MKQTVYTNMTIGTNSKIDLELQLDIIRELTDIDKRNIRKHIGNLIEAIQEETLNLDPKIKIRSKDEKLELISLFKDNLIYIDEIPNEYDNSFYNKHFPWFIITTIKGRIKIGWRKRVISIDWSDSLIKEKASDLFPNEDVTKGDNYIHAWGLEKAQEYINILLK